MGGGGRRKKVVSCCDWEGLSTCFLRQLHVHVFYSDGEELPVDP